jgi:hypothetical protein
LFGRCSVWPQTPTQANQAKSAKVPVLSVDDFHALVAWLWIDRILNDGALIPYQCLDPFLIFF